VFKCPFIFNPALKHGAMDTFPHKTQISSFNLTALPPNPPNRGAFMHGIVPSMLVTSFLPMLSSQPAVSSFPPIGGIERGGTIGGNFELNSTCNAPQPPESGGFHPWHLTEIIEISSQPAVSSLPPIGGTEGGGLFIFPPNFTSRACIVRFKV